MGFTVAVGIRVATLGMGVGDGGGAVKRHATMPTPPATATTNARPTRRSSGYPAFRYRVTITVRSSPPMFAVSPIPGRLGIW